MEQTERYIVAVDLGSSKMALSVALVNGDDVQILYYKERPSEGIRYSSVLNVTKAYNVFKDMILEAEEELGIKITQVVVGMPKYPVLQVVNTARETDRGEDADITREDVENLKRFAQNNYPLEDDKRLIYGAVAQSFSDGENFQVLEDDIIGMTGDVLEGNFKLFIGKKVYLDKIDQMMNKLGVPASRKYFTADTTARVVLTQAEMESGVALVDFGGGCTSVSIYYGNIMRHYSSIPFGGGNITEDITNECQLSSHLAENIKLAYGACLPEKLQSMSEKIIHIRSNSADPDSQLPVKYLSEIITCRVEEILMAIFYEIEKSGFADKLRSGIVVTGGVAQTANLGNLIYDLSGYKSRVGYPLRKFSFKGCDGIADTSATSAVGLIMAAKEDLGVACAIVSSDYASVLLNAEAEPKPEVNEMPGTVEPAEVVAETVEPAEAGNKEEDKKAEEKKKEKEKKPKKRMGWGDGFKKTIFGIVKSGSDEDDRA